MAFRPKLSEIKLCNLHPYTSCGSIPASHNPLTLRNHQPRPQANLHYRSERRRLGNKRGWPHMLTRQGWLETGNEAEKWYIFIYILSSRWISSVGRALNYRVGGRGFDSLGRTNTQGLKTTEKWRYCLCPANGETFAWLGLTSKMAVWSPVGDVKIVWPISAFVQDTFKLK